MEIGTLPIFHFACLGPFFELARAIVWVVERFLEPFFNGQFLKWESLICESMKDSLFVNCDLWDLVWEVGTLSKIKNWGLIENNCDMILNI